MSQTRTWAAASAGSWCPAESWSDYDRMRSLGVKFLEEPRQEEYGTVVVFKDLYGNKWDLLQLKAGQNH